MPYAHSVLLFIFTALPAKTSNANSKEDFDKYPYFPLLSFLFNHSVHKNNLAESPQVWEQPSISSLESTYTWSLLTTSECYESLLLLLSQAMCCHRQAASC